MPELIRKQDEKNDNREVSNCMTSMTVPSLLKLRERKGAQSESSPVNT